MTATLTVLFWLAAGLLAYTYVGYPGLMALVARFRPRMIRKGPIRPRVTLLVVAHNEASRLEAKLQNCLALDYPRDCLEIVVASDGSADGTVEVARRYEHDGVRVLAFEARRGKPSVLNDVVPEARGEIVVLADARQTFHRDALVALVENFHDPTVGAVSGELVLDEQATAIGEGVGFYWRYEKFIRSRESCFDSTVGATGAIYAIRRDLFEPIPADTLLDDVVIPLRVCRRGYRIVFEPGAKAFDRAAESAEEEFTRKVRTIGGNVQLLGRERWVWSIRQNRLWFQTVSHKFLRLVAPLLLGVAFVTSAAVSPVAPVYRAALVGQLLFYGAALAALFVGDVPRVGRWLAVPYAFCLLNWTTVVGVTRFLSGAQTVTWRKASASAANRAGTPGMLRGAGLRLRRRSRG